MSRKVAQARTHVSSFILVAAVLAVIVSCKGESSNRESEPRKSVLIGSVQNMGPDAALVTAFNELLISEFTDVSAWTVVVLPEFDYKLVGEPREQEMHRLGLRFFLATRVTTDLQGNVFIRAQLTDAWTERNIWTHRVSGHGSTIKPLAVEIARLTHDTLGEP